MQPRVARRVGKAVYAIVSVTVGVLNIATLLSELPLVAMVGLFGASAFVYLAATVIVARLQGEEDSTTGPDAVMSERPGRAAVDTAEAMGTVSLPPRRLTTALRLDIGVAVGLVVSLGSGIGVAFLCHWSQWAMPLCFAAMFGSFYLVIRSVKCPVCGMVASDDGTVRQSRWRPRPINPTNHQCRACGALFTQV